MNLKMYEKRYNNNEALVEVYQLLTKEYQKMSESDEKTIKAFEPLESAVANLSEKEAINKIILYWVTYFTYFARISYLMNIVSLSEKKRRIKNKEVKEFKEIANSHIIRELDSAFQYMQWHISYFYFKLIEVRSEISLSETIDGLYIRAYQSAVQFVDSHSGKSASKFSETYAIEGFLKNKITQKIYELEKMTEGNA